MMTRLLVVAALAAAFVAGFMMRGVALPGEAVASAQTTNKVYELRTYVVPDDKFALLNARFRDHTMRIFNKHGMTNVGYFIPQDDVKAKDTLVYLLQHPSRAAADENWKKFGSDPEWTKVAADSGVGRVIVTREFLNPTDYSPMK
jgi:hypothetical protein